MMPHAEQDTILIQLVYATPQRIWRHDMRVCRGCSAGQAIDASPFAAEFPEYAHHVPAIGIYGQACARERVLDDGDRIEIYRPLSFDPMESRRRRAAHRPILRNAKITKKGRNE
ncbi:MAG TPA: RnfH family protein [Candidimonas sp.]|nr:RnfH family protein [Candidimonas sp.]